MSWSARAALYKISEIGENILSEHRLFCHKFKICPALLLGAIVLIGMKYEL